MGDFREKPSDSKSKAFLRFLFYSRCRQSWTEPGFLATLHRPAPYLSNAPIRARKNEEMRENGQVKVGQKPLWATQHEFCRFSKNRSQPTLKLVLPTIWKIESPTKPNYKPNLEFTARTRWHGTKKVGMWQGTNSVRLLLQLF